MFYQNYLDLCNARGLSPNEAARACGIKSSGSVTGWKKGSVPRQAVLKRIADFFGCTVEDLTSDKKIPAVENGGHESESDSPVISEKRKELNRLVGMLSEQEVSVLLPQVRGIILDR